MALELARQQVELRLQLGVRIEGRIRSLTGGCEEGAEGQEPSLSRPRHGMVGRQEADSAPHAMQKLHPGSIDSHGRNGQVVLTEAPRCRR